MAKLLLGKEVTAAMNEKLQARVAALKEKGVSPKLAIVRCGENPSDLSYEKGATARAELIGVEVEKFVLPEDVTKEALIAQIEAINADDSIHGCLMFRPLPPHLDTPRVARTLDASKDVDAMTSSAMGVLLSPSAVGYAPCTAQASLEILKYYQIPLQGKRITVIGKSMTVGLPTALLMMNEEATVSVCHILSRPEDTRDLCKDADIIISAAGCPGLVTRDYVRHGQIVVDVGVTLGKDGKLHGDVAFEEVEPIVEAITPVPGGVGTVTTSVLVSHVVEAAEKSV